MHGLSGGADASHWSPPRDSKMFSKLDARPARGFTTCLWSGLPRWFLANGDSECVNALARMGKYWRSLEKLNSREFFAGFALPARIRLPSAFFFRFFDRPTNAPLHGGYVRRGIPSASRTKFFRNTANSSARPPQ